MKNYRNRLIIYSVDILSCISKYHMFNCSTAFKLVCRSIYTIKIKYIILICLIRLIRLIKNY